MIIIYEKPGRLANSLWLYAHFIAFAAEHNVSLAFPAMEDYGSYFRSLENSLLYRYPEKKSVVSFSFLRKLIVKCFSFFVYVILKIGIKPSSIELLQINNNADFDLENEGNLSQLKQKLVIVKGWLYRSNTLIVKHRTAVLNFFRPIEKHEKNILGLIEKCRKECEVLIGMHIRREDYKTFLDGIYYYEMEDYKNKMLELRKLFADKKVTFLICSNEIMNPADFSDFNIVMANDHIIEDMYSLAKCDFIVGPPSTYSMWASFYGNVPLYQIKKIKEPIALKDFEVTKN